MGSSIVSVNVCGPQDDSWTFACPHTGRRTPPIAVDTPVAEVQALFDRLYDYLYLVQSRDGVPQIYERLPLQREVCRIMGDKSNSAVQKRKKARRS